MRKRVSAWSFLSGLQRNPPGSRALGVPRLWQGILLQNSAIWGNLGTAKYRDSPGLGRYAAPRFGGFCFGGLGFRSFGVVKFYDARISSRASRACLKMR